MTYSEFGVQPHETMVKMEYSTGRTGGLQEMTPMMIDAISLVAYTDLLFGSER